MRRANTARRIAAVVVLLSATAAGPVPKVAAAAPTPGGWTATGSLPNARGFAPAVLLGDGTVITAGGTDGYSFTDDARRWTAGTWVAAGTIGQAVAGQVAALLPNGKALFAGGADDMSYYKYGDVFDPVGGTWAKTPGKMAHAHAYGQAASLTSGDVLVIGGYDDSGDVTGAVDIYSASGGTWSAGSPLPAGRFEFTATTLKNGHVLVAGGDDGSNASSSSLSSVEIYDGSGWSAAESMKKVRVDQSAVLLQDGRVLVAGGVDASGKALDSAEVYDPTSGHWTLVGTMSSVRAGFTMTVLPDGRVVAVGGYTTDPSAALTSADLFDPTTGGWTGTGALQTGRRFQAATSLGDGSVLVVGGHGASSDYLSSCEVYTPPPARIIYPATTFHPLAPTRILDTRVPNNGNGLSNYFYPHVPRRFQVDGRGGVPAKNDPHPAVAVTGILTTTASTAAGYLTIGPVFTGAPTSSSLNFPKGDNRANNVAVALDADGMLSVVYVGSGKTHALFDVTGYFTADDTGATFKTLDPGRVLDSRDGTGLREKIRFVNKVWHSFQVIGNAHVPDGALAVTGNLTVVTPSSGGWAFVGPSQMDPDTMNNSTVNSPAHDTRANGVTVKLAGDGTLSAVWVGADGSSADLLFDVTGYFVAGTSGSRFVPVEPIRVVDTRYNLPFTGPVSRATPVTITLGGHGIIPADAAGISGNLTVTLQSYQGLLTVAPHLDAGVMPQFSTLNFPKGDNRANGFYVSLSDGSFAVVYEATRSASTHFIVDLTGYFQAPS